MDQTPDQKLSVRQQQERQSFETITGIMMIGAMAQ